MTFVTAVNRNGKKQTIPAEWLDHPVLGRDFHLPRRNQDRPARGTRGTAHSNKTRTAGDKE